MDTPLIPAGRLTLTSGEPVPAVSEVAVYDERASMWKVGHFRDDGCFVVKETVIDPQPDAVVSG
jgi:hypothetical protein